MKKLSFGLTEMMQVTILCFTGFLFLITLIVWLFKPTIIGFFQLVGLILIVFYINKFSLRFFEVYLGNGLIKANNLVAKKEIELSDFDRIERGTIYPFNSIIIILKNEEKIYFSVNPKLFFSQLGKMDSNYIINKLKEEILQEIEKKNKTINL